MKDILTQKELRKNYKLGHEKIIDLEENYGLKRYTEGYRSVLR